MSATNAAAANARKTANARTVTVANVLTSHTAGNTEKSASVVRVRSIWEKRLIRLTMDTTKDTTMVTRYKNRLNRNRNTKNTSHIRHLGDMASICKIQLSAPKSHVVAANVSQSASV